LKSSLSLGRIGVRVFAAGVFSVGLATLAGADQRPAPASKDLKPDPAVAAAAAAQQQEIQALLKTADTAMSGQVAPADFPIQLQNDFLKAQGNRVWVPITLTIDPAKVAGPALSLYVRVVPRGMTTPPAPPAPPAAASNDKNAKDKDKKKDQKGAVPPPPAPSYPFEDVSFFDVKSAPGQPIRVTRGLGVPTGSYDLYIVMHERAAAGAGGKSSVLKHALDVPNYANGEFATSTVILAERVDQLAAPITPDQQTEHPYAFGQTEIVLAPEHKFKKSQELIVLMQIYHPMTTPEKKFSLEATYTFYRQDSGGEKRFNSTEPQAFSSEQMGPGFDPSSGSIQAGQGVPLQSFPEGAYRLEIKVTDKLSAKVLTQNVNFTVTP
jgi:hypothetical protein